MCRNIKTLYNFEPAATETEIRAAATQYVRKVTGFTKPSKVNEDAFNQAIDEITKTTVKLFASMETKAVAKNRDKEAAKAKIRAAKRFTK